MRCFFLLIKSTAQFFFKERSTGLKYFLFFSIERQKILTGGKKTVRKISKKNCTKKQIYKIDKRF